MGRPDPERKLHANRIYSTPWSSQGKNACFSRTDFLEDKMDTAFAADQSMTVAATGESETDPDTWPKNWPRAGQLLGVPKCVILSSLPFWTAWWPDCYFQAPRDVIGQDGVGAIVNYYYFEQWNTTTDDLAPESGAYSSDSEFFDNFDKADSPDGRKPPKDLYSTYWNDSLNNRPHEGENSIDPMFQAPSARFSQIVGKATNPYYSQHQQLLKVFNDTKQVLEEKYSIMCIVPEWVGPKLYQVRNFFLTKSFWNRNAAHGGSVNGRRCEISDSLPCYRTDALAWGPSYPNTDDPRNNIDFIACGMPMLATTDPGFGTDVLHIYVGHPCIRYAEGNDIWGYQAWPLTPEAEFLGPIMLGNYLEQSNITPFFNGRRFLWEHFGFDYGFMNHGALGVYNWYEAIYKGGADKYKENFWNYRNFTTKWYTYSEKWQFTWTFDKIFDDRRDDCPATQFYFGLSYEDLINLIGTEDNIVSVDCAPPLAYSEVLIGFPALESLRHAVSVSFPLIRKRIEDYYNNIESGCAELYQMIIDKQELADYNVSYNGDCRDIADGGALLEMILTYFNIKTDENT